MPLLVEPALVVGCLRGRGQPELVGDGVGLRPWRAGDVGAVRGAFGDAEIQRWHVRRLDSDEEALEWIAQWGRRWDEESAASWAVVDEADVPLGQVGLREISLAEGSAGISYWVTPAARGQGIATRSVKLLCAWAFDIIGFNRLNLHHSTANTASCRVAQRTGFPLEGTLRQAIKHTDGYHNWHTHGRLHTDPQPT